MKDILIFNAKALNNIDNINKLSSEFYSKTGLKLSITFNGSKGYLDNIEFNCELRKSENKIPISLINYVKGADDGIVVISIDNEKIYTNYTLEPVLLIAANKLGGIDKVIDMTNAIKIYNESLCIK